jgi:hypothetical protein
MRLEDHIAEVVGDISDLHSLLGVRSPRHQRIEDSVMIARNRIDLADPYWMLDHGCRAWQHLQVAHHIEAAVYQHIDVFRLDGAGMSCFGRN